MLVWRQVADYGKGSEEMAELMDLYDGNKRLLNKTINRGKGPQAGQFVLMVHGILINKAGDLLVQKRVPSKSYWPSKWDLSCSGAVMAGESSQEGLRREFKEELGLDINLSKYAPTLTAAFQGGLSDYYIVEKDVDLSDLTIEDREISEVKWLSQDQVFEYIDKDAFVPYQKSFLRALLDVYTAKSEICPN